MNGDLAVGILFLLVGAGLIIGAFYVGEPGLVPSPEPPERIARIDADGTLQIWQGDGHDWQGDGHDWERPDVEKRDGTIEVILPYEIGNHKKLVVSILDPDHEQKLRTFRKSVVAAGDSEQSRENAKRYANEKLMMEKSINGFLGTLSIFLALLHIQEAAQLTRVGLDRRVRRLAADVRGVSESFRSRFSRDHDSRQRRWRYGADEMQSHQSSSQNHDQNQWRRRESQADEDGENGGGS